MPSDLGSLLDNRRSVRAFTDAPVDRLTVEKLCKAARRAPSGANLQPGKFHALAGPALDALKDRLLAAAADPPTDLEYSYFPAPMTPALKDRQRRAGYALYQSIGIDRRDVQRRKDQFSQNYRFFDAPVGIIVTIDRAMGKGCFMDLGMAMMTFLLAAEDQGLGASGIGAIANYGAIVHEHLHLPDDEMVVCGIALGVPDKTAAINQFKTERLDLADYATFQGFDDGTAKDG